MALYLHKLESSSPKDAIKYGKFGWNWLSDSVEEDFMLLMYFHYLLKLPLKKGSVFLEKKIFKLRQCIFTISLIKKRTRPFIWTILNSRHPGMHCAKIGWNKPIGYGEDFKNFVNVVLLVPLEKGGGGI